VSCATAPVDAPRDEESGGALSSVEQAEPGCRVARQAAARVERVLRDAEAQARSLRSRQRGDAVAEDLETIRDELDRPDVADPQSVSIAVERPRHAALIRSGIAPAAIDHGAVGERRSGPRRTAVVLERSEPRVGPG